MARHGPLTQPEALRFCTLCAQPKPLTDYTPVKGTQHRSGLCKPCKAAVVRAARHGEPRPVPTRRHCPVCGEVKPIVDFASARPPIRTHLTCGACRAAAKAVLAKPAKPQPLSSEPCMRVCTDCG